MTNELECHFMEPPYEELQQNMKSQQMAEMSLSVFHKIISKENMIFG